MKSSRLSILICLSAAALTVACQKKADPWRAIDPRAFHDGLVMLPIEFPRQRLVAEFGAPSFEFKIEDLGSAFSDSALNPEEQELLRKHSNLKGQFTSFSAYANYALWKSLFVAPAELKDYDPNWFESPVLEGTDVLLYVERERFGEKRFLNQAFAFFVRDGVVQYKAMISYWLDGKMKLPAPEDGARYDPGT